MSILGACAHPAVSEHTARPHKILNSFFHLSIIEHVTTLPTTARSSGQGFASVVCQEWSWCVGVEMIAKMVIKKTTGARRLILTTKDQHLAALPQ
jgi:hypothetical protein